MSFLWWLSQFRSALPDRFFLLVTRLGEETVAVLIMCAIYWCVDKKLGYLVGTTYFFSGVLVQGMKLSFRIERPWVLDPGFQAVEEATINAGGYSFPSGHTQSAFTLFGTLALRQKRKLYAAALLFGACIVGFSRMWLGVHTPADVLVGAALTLAIAYGVNRLCFTEKEVSKPNVLPLILLLCSAVLTALCLMLRSQELIGEDYAIDGLKTAGSGLGFAAGMFVERTMVRFETKSKSVVHQILKYALGVVGVLAIRIGLKGILSLIPGGDMIRYFLIIFWIIALYPMIIRRFFQIKSIEK